MEGKQVNWSVRESLSGATFAGEIAEGKSGDGKSESVSVFYFLKNKKEKKKMKLKENDLCLKDNLISQIWLKISGFWRFNWAESYSVKLAHIDFHGFSDMDRTRGYLFLCFSVDFMKIILDH